MRDKYIYVDGYGDVIIIDRHRCEHSKSFIGVLSSVQHHHLGDLIGDLVIVQNNNGCWYICGPCMDKNFIYNSI